MTELPRGATPNRPEAVSQLNGKIFPIAVDAPLKGAGCWAALGILLLGLGGGARAQMASPGPGVAASRGPNDRADERGSGPSAAGPVTPRTDDTAPGSRPSAAAGGGSSASPESIPRASNVQLPEGAQRPPEANFLTRLLGLEGSPVKVSGWIENSYTGNTNGVPRSGTNFGVFPNHLADRWQGNQYYLIVENPVESSDRVNLGFRYDLLFGNDWQFTKSYGLFDRAFPPNSFAGVDFPQIYGEIHLPILTRHGLDIRGGRWYSPAGFEGVQATKRPLLSVPYTLNFTPFTFFGMLGVLHLLEENRADLYAGTVNGWDRWINQSYRWGVLGGYSLSSRSKKTTLNMFCQIGPDQLPSYPPANSPFLPTGVTPAPFLAGRRNLGYAANPRSYFSTVLTQKWSDRLTEAIQTDQVLDKNTPGFGPGGTNQSTSWYSLAHWLLYGFDDALETARLTGAWRFEVFRDNNGAATGVANTFFETSMGLIIKPRPWLWIRPEARYDWARAGHPFNDGTRHSQLILDIDLLVLF
jgi:hypothetical protein